MDAHTLPAGTRMGRVRLRVASLERELAFYRDVLGFEVHDDDGATAVLGVADGAPLLELRAEPGAPRRTARATGLFHVAFLHPTRADLAATLHRVRREGYRIDGFADHNVSEAAYLTDPEGNGLELYVDRPRDVWTAPGGAIHMTTEALDLAGLLATAWGPSVGIARGTVVGHVHLRVSSLADAEAFYVDRLGFEVVTRAYPGALFVSAGGYHHHLGLNVWGGRATAPPEGALGLASFDVVVPGRAEHARVRAWTGASMLLDPDGNSVRLVSAF